MKKEKRRLVEFLDRWIKADYEGMFNLCQKTWCENHDVISLKSIIVHFFNNSHLVKYKILRCYKITDYTTDYEIRLIFDRETKVRRVRLIKELEPYKPDPKADAGINPLSITKPYQKGENENGLLRKIGKWIRTIASTKFNWCKEGS